MMFVMTPAQEQAIKLNCREMEARVRAVELHISRLDALFRESHVILAKLTNMQEKTTNMIYGSENIDGIKAEIGRLKECEAKRQKHVLMIWTAFIGLIVNLFLGAIKFFTEVMKI